MRRIGIGLLFAFAAASGCAAPEGESDGFMGNYNGFPWQSLMRKNSNQNSTDTRIQHPEYAPAGRFTQPIGTTTANTAAADPSTAESSPPDESSAEPAPPAK